MTQGAANLQAHDVPLSRRSFIGGVTAAFSVPSGLFADSSPPPIDGLTAGESSAIRELVAAFMHKHDVPGLSLAIARHGRLALAEGFGVANRQTQESVTPAHLFRVASVSKPLTSITVMRLIENGELALDDHVFGNGGHLDHLYNPRTIRLKRHRDRLEQLTVQHLLEHTCGGWGNKENDPMFDWGALDFDHDALIPWVLKNHPLPRDPGGEYDYSNFGYCLLARMIESVSGESYETHVRKQVLEPAGAGGMRLALEEVSARLPGEVEYHGQEEDPNHKVMRVRRMDGHGGWVASAIDLVRLLVHVDLFERPADILEAQTIRTMTTPSAANRNYARGWQVNKHDNWWHIGSFNGAMSIIVRTSHGYCWSILINTRSRKKDASNDLDMLAWQVLECVKHWPQHDLFETLTNG